MTYEEAMPFWFGRVNYEQKTPHVGDFKLDRMRQLLARVGDPHHRLRIVHVAGSKGKGSTAAMLASILQHAGYRVGLFTSPHLVHVEERFQIDRQPIPQDDLAALLTEIRGVVPEELERELTFFEIGTAVGFLHFLRQGVDVAIVEVGLGGRFDSTNVCAPMLSIITSISFDHTQMLGNTLAKIAFEKAGIVKPGRPTISGVRHPEARATIEAACAARHAPLTQLDADFAYVHTPARIAENDERPPSVQVTTRGRAWPKMTLGLIGEHQARNAAIAVAAVEELNAQGVTIPERAVRDGLAGVVWPARLDIVARRPLVVLDCAHNVASAKALAQALTESFPLRGGRRILIFGGNRDKDLQGMLDVLAPLFDRVHLTSFQSTSRCLPAEQLAERMPASKRSGCALSQTSAEAWRLARAEAQPGDLIVVAGSVFLAGEIARMNHASGR